MNQLRDTLGMAFSVLVWPILLYVMPRYWRNERGLHPDTPPPGWPMTLATWRALARAWPLAAVTFVIAIPFAFGAEFATDGSALFAIAMTVLGLDAILLWFVALPAVILFNRPRFLVAPHHRALPGWLAERRGAPVPPTPEPAKPPKWHLAPR